MYRSQVVSRSQRRTEKRQIIFFLLLVLGVALGSFILGVLVGRNLPTVSHGGEVAKLPVMRPLPAPAETVVPVATAMRPPEATPNPSSTQLSFYDTLPKGEKPPLGSGINVSGNPGGASAEPVAASAPPLPKPSGSESVQRTAPATKAVEPASGGPVKEQGQKASVAAVAAQYYLQVASFPKAEEAQALAKRLQRKGHETSVDQSGGAGKGVWYRIFTGPYASAEVAKKAAERLRSEERLAPILRKR